MTNGREHRTGVAGTRHLLPIQSPTQAHWKHSTKAVMANTATNGAHAGRTSPSNRRQRAASPRFRHRSRLCAMVIAVALLGSAGIANAADVVVMTSGDRLVGEIKNVDKDVL